MALEVLSSICAKLEGASLKNNEILEINVLQKLTLHALWQLFLNASESYNFSELATMIR